MINSYSFTGKVCSSFCSCVRFKTLMVIFIPELAELIMTALYDQIVQF